MKASGIQLLAICYFEAFISNTLLLDPGEHSAMTITDMLILHSALYPNQQDMKLNLGAFLFAIIFT